MKRGICTLSTLFALPCLALLPWAQAASAATGSQCGSQGSAFTTVFADNFPGASLDPANWNVNANGGSIVVGSGAVALGGSPFPYVTAAGTPIPATGPFSVRWTATYVDAPTLIYGTGSLVLTDSLPANGATSWTSTADAWQDNYGYRVEVRTGASGSVSAYSEATPAYMPHDVEYCWLDSTTQVFVDGVQRLQQARDPGVPRPTTLWFGTPVNIAGIWKPFSLDSVRVSALPERVYADNFEAINAAPTLSYQPLLAPPATYAHEAISICRSDVQTTGSIVWDAADADSGNGVVTLNVKLLGGVGVVTIAMAPFEGLEVLEDGRWFTMTAPIDAVATALTTLSYKATADADVTVVITIDDNGYSGACSGAQSGACNRQARALLDIAFHSAPCQ